MTASSNPAVWINFGTLSSWVWTFAAFSSNFAKGGVSISGGGIGGFRFGGGDGECAGDGDPGDELLSEI